LKKMLLLAMLVIVTMFALIAPASAQQVIPNVKGLTPYSAQTNFMSLPGYLRWQYYIENGNVWVSIQEATQLVNSQISPAG